MKVKVALEVSVNETSTKELVFEKCGSDSSVDIYWHGDYLGTVDVNQLEDWMNALADVFLLPTARKEAKAEQ